MATVFGISGLRSRLADWRGSWKIGNPSRSENADAQSPIKTKSSIKAHDAANDDAHHDRDLSRVIENLVIPRLIANWDNSPEANGYAAQLSSDTHLSSLEADVAISHEDIVQFSMLSVRDNPEAMLDFVDARLAMGCSVEMLYVELLAPAARELGKDWEDDSLDFVDVTMGLWRIQEILRELSARVPPKVRPMGFQPSALFSALPGEQHSFGTIMVSECFERAGWQVDALIEPSQSDLNVKCAEQYFDLVGLTVTADTTSATLRSLVSTIRSISRNPDVRIMLGGRFINDNPALVEASGADATAADAVSAVAIADKLARLKVYAADRHF